MSCTQNNEITRVTLVNVGLGSGESPCLITGGRLSRPGPTDGHHRLSSYTEP